MHRWNTRLLLSPLISPHPHQDSFYSHSLDQIIAPLTGLNMGTLTYLQLESKLFNSPTAVRRAIYAHLVPEQLHINVDKGKFRLSKCVQQDGDDHPDCDKRRSHGHANTGCLIDVDFLPRLQSSWGPHWRCEELVSQDREKHGETGRGVPVMALFLTCKRM